jgi:hypothetical protein
MMTFYKAFGDVVTRHLPKINKHLTKLGDDTTASPFLIKWLNSFHLEIFSLQTAFRVMDSYLMEGYKVLYRYGVAALTLRAQSILECRSIDAIEKLYADASRYSTAKGDDDRLCDKAFNFSFSRSEVNKYCDNVVKKNLVRAESGNRIDQYANSRIMPNVATDSDFLKDEHWAYVWSWIPKRYKMMDVDLIFSVATDGYNLGTFYDNCSTGEPQLMIMETTEGAVFGAYLSNAWNENGTGNRFSGTAESAF